TQGMSTKILRVAFSGQPHDLLSPGMFGARPVDSGARAGQWSRSGQGKLRPLHRPKVKYRKADGRYALGGALGTAFRLTCNSGARRGTRRDGAGSRPIGPVAHI